MNATVYRCYGPCQERKPAADFSKDAGKTRGLKLWCKDCVQLHERPARLEREAAQESRIREVAEALSAWPAPRAIA